ncbi:DUF4097 family beta strand repeat-containing protein [Streptomyces sp. Root1310]|uniref:DUF4097 family beta strand repeat-containing protein n=1 Tax=Streptomyces sp. Root1310 TaxID=1736452 RepID=UPI00070C1E80|nr:DUF4097 family beta strand repeat-containing protein [Streptomyces sp. Root1310]KQX65348.1 hypothetical protein ASD48_20020 [Streptomyces sp. Root1310]
MKAKPARPVLLATVVLAVLPFAVSCGDQDHEGAGGSAAAGPPALARSGTHLVITTENGLVLRPADGRRVTVDDRADGAWSHDDDTWTLDLSCTDREGKGEWERERREEACPRTPYVKVPDGVSVTVSARNAGVDVAGLAAALDVTTVNGDVTVTSSGRNDAPVRLATRNGSVRATALDAGRLNAATTNGDVILACATAPSGVTAATTNGSVAVTVPHDAPAYLVTAGTDNGRATVSVPTSDDRQGPAMTLTTVNGDVGVRRD